MQCDVTRCIIYISNKREYISTKNAVTKILPKKLYCYFKWSLQLNLENPGQNFVSVNYKITQYPRQLSAITPAKYLPLLSQFVSNFY